MCNNGKSLKQEKTDLTLLHCTVYTCTEADNLDCFRNIMEIYIFSYFLLFLEEVMPFLREIVDALPW